RFLGVFGEFRRQLASISLISTVIWFVGSSAIAEDRGEIERLKERGEQLKEQFEWSEAASVAEEILVLTEQQHGKQDAQTADAMYSSAWLANCAGQSAKAEVLWEKTLALEEKLFGKDS